MDLASLAITAVTSLVAAASGVVVTAWKLSRDMAEIRGLAKSANDKADSNAVALAAHQKETAASWQEQAETLGYMRGRFDSIITRK